MKGLETTIESSQNRAGYFFGETWHWGGSLRFPTMFGGAGLIEFPVLGGDQA